MKRTDPHINNSTQKKVHTKSFNLNEKKNKSRFSTRCTVFNRTKLESEKE